MRRVDELPAVRAGFLGFVAFLFAGLIVLHLPTWGFVLGVPGLLSLLVWLALSGQPVVKLIWPEQPEAVPAILSPPKPVRTDEPLPMVELPGGEFWMGEREERHRVKVRPFAIGKYPVTQKRYQELMGKNPSYFREKPAEGERAEERPVENVNWFDAVRFCNRLSEKVGRKQCYRITEPEAGSEAQPEVEWDREADGYRLPTEAEWEYACRAGTETAYSFGDEEAKLGEYAWFEGNSDNQTHTVGQKKPNDWELHDLHGNVWEWCWDWYDDYKVTSDNDKSVTLSDPIGPPSGSWRVVRGGSFRFGPRDLHSASRRWDGPESRIRLLGFRCVRGSGRQP
jgi:formylglycine-generating enzyme required for sulfatase activity